jgi:hypothetical protein
VFPELHRDRAENEPETGAGQERDDGLHRVRQLGGEDVVLLEAYCQQPGCQAIDQSVQPGERVAARVSAGEFVPVRRVDDRFPFSRCGDGSAEHVVDAGPAPPAAPLVLGYTFR